MLNSSGVRTTLQRPPTSVVRPSLNVTRPQPTTAVGGGNATPSNAVGNVFQNVTNSPMTTGQQLDPSTPHVLREQDRFLPIANIARVMKRYVPESGKVAKDSKECIQECVSEFISFITSEASERCQTEKRKTINGEDILWAMQSLGFDPYVEPLKLYLSKYRSACKGDKALQEMGLIPQIMMDDEPMIMHDSSDHRPQQICITSSASNQDLAVLFQSNPQIFIAQDAKNASQQPQQMQVVYLDNTSTTGNSASSTAGGAAVQFVQFVPASGLAEQSNR